MQVIGIKKHITNGCKVGYIILGGVHNQEEIEEQVEDWCYAEPNGHGNGWTYTWCEITEDESKSKIILDEILKIDGQITRLSQRREELLNEIPISFVKLKS